MLNFLEATALDDVATALGTAVQTNTMLSTLATLIPVIGGVLIFAFTYRIIRRIITKAPKGKVGI